MPGKFPFNIVVPRILKVQIATASGSPSRTFTWTVPDGVLGLQNLLTFAQRENYTDYTFLDSTYVVFLCMTLV